MNFSAVILAGGKSTRMGRDKALLEIGGRTLLARQVALARETGAAEIFISGRAGGDYSAFHPACGVRVLRDKFTDAGPLGGIERALAAASSPLVLVLAVDLPDMNAAFLTRLAAGCSGTCGAIPRRAGGAEPLAAFYPRAAQPLAAASLGQKKFAARNFAGQCVQAGLARFMELAAGDESCFTNWNFPADFAAAGPAGRPLASQ